MYLYIGQYKQFLLHLKFFLQILFIIFIFLLIYLVYPFQLNPYLLITHIKLSAFSIVFMAFLIFCKCNTLLTIWSNNIKMIAQKQETLIQAIKAISSKMELLNFENYQPPYLLNTLAQLRKAHLKDIIYQYKDNSQEGDMKGFLKSLSVIVDNLDEQSFQKYSQRLTHAYLSKMKNEEWEFSGVPFGEIQKKYNLKNQVNASLFWIIQWFLELQRMEDLLSRLQLYFQIKPLNLMANVQTRLSIQIDINRQTQEYVTKAKRLLSYTLKKCSSIISSPIFTGIVTSGLLITIAVLTNKTIPLEMKVNSKCFIPAGLTALVPSILDSIVYMIDREDTGQTVKKWQSTFLALTCSIKRFNDCVEKTIKVCVKANDMKCYEKQKTNMEKLFKSLNIDMELSKQFDEEQFEEMRKRTQAYFEEYLQFLEGEWTVVLSKQNEKLYRKASQGDQFEVLKMSKQLEQKTYKQLNLIQNQNQKKPLLKQQPQQQSTTIL